MKTIRVTDEEFTMITTALRAMHQNSLRARNEHEKDMVLAKHYGHSDDTVKEHEEFMNLASETAHDYEDCLDAVIRRSE
jgi:hypothetical protein